MKLEGVFDGQVYASRCRTVYAESGALDFRELTRLPGSVLRNTTLSLAIQTNCLTERVLAQLVGPYPTTNVWPITTDELYSTRGNRLYRTTDGGETWTTVRTLPPSSGPMGVLPTALCSHNGTAYLGEYPLDRTRKPRILATADGGRSWETVVTFDARHVHAVQVDPFTDDLWITTGDRDTECRIVRLSDGDMTIVGQGDQLWRAVELAFTPSAVLWGMDCPYADRNRILKLDRADIGAKDPDVETVHTVSSPVYYASTLEVESEHVVIFSTTIEPATEVPHSAMVLCASSANGFDTWHSLESYERRSQPLSRVIDTNAYIFVATDPDRGLFVNPYNTVEGHGTVRNVSFNRLRGVLD